jgi:hypothetical protein
MAKFRRTYTADEKNQIAALTKERRFSPFTIDPRIWPRAVRVAAVNARTHSYDAPCGFGVAGLVGFSTGPDWMVDCPACKCIMSLRCLAFLAPFRPSKENQTCEGLRDHGLGRWQCERARGMAPDYRNERPVPVVTQSCALPVPVALHTVVRREPCSGRLEVVDVPLPVPL